MKRLLPLLFVFLTAGCMKPLYETDYPLYRQYKYWESTDKDWQEVDQFQIQVFRVQTGDRTDLRLIAQRDGLPSTEQGYIRAAQKAAFNLMTQACGESMPAVARARPPEKGRKIDRFFYQYADGSLGVTFSCRAGKIRGMDLAAEQQKWSLADRRWESINGRKAFVDVLPAASNGLRQIRIRLFDGTVSDNRRLARKIVEDICPNTNFRILSDKAGLDITPAGHAPDIVSDENVRIYDFTCTP